MHVFPCWFVLDASIIRCVLSVASSLVQTNTFISEKKTKKKKFSWLLVGLIQSSVVRQAQIKLEIH